MGDFFKGKGTTNINPPRSEPTSSTFEPEIAEDPIRQALAEEAIASSKFQRETSADIYKRLVAGAEYAGPLLQALLQLDPREGALPEETQRVSGGIYETLKPGMERLADPNAGAELDFLEDEFTESILPELSSAGIRAGSPGGSGEQSLTLKAIRDYGRSTAAELTRQQATRFAAAASAAPTVASMGLAGPQARAALAALERSLGVQAAKTPLELAMNVSSGTRFPGVPAVPAPVVGGTTTGQQFFPTGGSSTQSMSGWEILQGIMNMGSSVGGAAAMGAMAFSSGKLKKDIEPLDVDEYAKALVKVRETPVVRYKYKWEGRERAPHIGPILEMSPEEIKEDDFRINVADYTGLTHAALKAVDRRVTALEEAFNAAAA